MKNYWISTELAPEVHWGTCVKGEEREGCFTTFVYVV